MTRKKVVPEYGTIMKRGVQYYRTRMQDADGNGFRYMHRLLKSCTINPLR